MTHKLANTLIAVALASTGCNDGSTHAPHAPSPTIDVPAPKPDTARSLGEELGVDPGGIAQSLHTAPLAVVTAAEGAKLRHAGSHGFFDDAKVGEGLGEGEQLRTLAAPATIVFADGTIMRVAEHTLVAIGSNGVTTLPAQSAAVLYGAAQFEVSERLAGQGNFRVLTPTAVVTSPKSRLVITIGVSGEGTIGTLGGSVSVRSNGDAVTIAKGHSVQTTALASPEPQSTNAWGTIRASGDEKTSTTATLAALKRAEKARTRLDSELGSVRQALSQLMDLDEKADDARKSKSAEAYAAISAPFASTIDAVYTHMGNAEHAALQLLAAAYVAEQLATRVPESKVDDATVIASVLLWKKVQLVATRYTSHARGTYYSHHPRGRARARSLKVTVDPFYATVLASSSSPPPSRRTGGRPVVRSSFDLRGPKRDWHASAQSPAPSNWYGASVATQLALAPSGATSLLFERRPRVAAQSALLEFMEPFSIAWRSAAEIPRHKRPPLRTHWRGMTRPAHR